MFNIFKENERLKNDLDKLGHEFKRLQERDNDRWYEDIQKERQHDQRIQLLVQQLNTLEDIRTKNELLTEELIKAKRRIIQLETDIEAKK